jgi:hypothetical protein
MPVMNFDLEDGKPPVTFTLKESDTVRFVAFMAECDRALNGRAAKPAVPVKDHVIAQTVNELRDIAIQFHDAQQLRERIAHVIVPLLSATPPLPVAQGVPGGYALVPVEPTGDMQAAGAQAIRFDTTVLNKLWTGNAVFRAMVAAAVPTPPAAPKEPTCK